MLSLLWKVSTVLRGYLRFYMPANIAIDWLRTPRGVKWAIPVALVAVPAYLFAMSICATLVERGGPGYLNALVILFLWSAAKFAAMGALRNPVALWRRVASARTTLVSKESCV